MYFDNLDQDKFPTLDQLFRAALSLYDNYSTPRAGAMFKLGCELDSSIVSIGEPWREEEDTEPKPIPADTNGTDTKPKPIPVNTNNTDTKRGEEDGAEEQMKEKGTVSTEGEKFNGDHTLMRSALFMYKALVSKEVAQAVAEGDIGRVYEGIKVSHQLNCNLTILIVRSSCCSHSQDPRTTSTPVTCSK